MPVITNIKEEFVNILPQAKNLKIAVSLAKNEAFMFIQENINKAASQSYIIGIDLPTDYEVFEQLFNSKYIESRVFLAKQVFHAKLYIFELIDKSVAYITSANLTMGGLSNNIELTYKIEDQSEIEYLSTWYDDLFAKNDEITDKFLADYLKKRTENNEIENKLKGRRTSIGKLKNDHHKEPLPVEIQSEEDLLAIDFSDKFFKAEHYLAFWGNKPYDSKFDKERIAVKDRLLDLKELLDPEIRNNHLNIYPHYQERFWTSVPELDSANEGAVKAVWLHYGKSKDEIKYLQSIGDPDSNTFIYNERIQIVVRKKQLEVSLIIGKEKRGDLIGSAFDRGYLKEHLIKDKTFQQNFLEHLKVLYPSYWIDVNGNSTTLSFFKNEQEILDVLRSDRFNSYFTIGREYNPSSAEISELNIVNTIVTEITKLYPLYELIKYK